MRCQDGEIVRSLGAGSIGLSLKSRGIDVGTAELNHTKMKVTRDHQVPKSRGGLTTVENLVIACSRCNFEKADMDVETYRWFLEDKRAAGLRVVFYGERVPQPWYL